MPRTWEDYLEGKSALVSAMSSAGIELAVRIADVVYNWTVVINRAFAEMQDNAVLAGTTVLNAWVTIAGMTDQVSTATLAFATDQYTYSGPNQTYPCRIGGVVSVLGSVDTDDYEVGIFVNSVLQTKMRVTANSAEHRLVPVEGHVILATGDVIDLRIRNITATNDITVVDATLNIGQTF